jgi:hypothetical protein
MGTVEEIRLKDGFQYQYDGHLGHPVLQGGDAQGPFAAVGFGELVQFPRQEVHLDVMDVQKIPVGDAVMDL